MLRFFTFIFIISGFYGCQLNKDSDKSPKHGGMLKMNEIEYVRTLFPPKHIDLASAHVIAQIYEGLVKYNPEIDDVIPAISYRWEVDDTSETVYTFYLRNDVFFHNSGCFPDSVGRKVTAYDFEYSFHLMCLQSTGNRHMSPFLNILGVKDYYNASASGFPKSSIEGIKALNDSVFQIILEKKNPFFISRFLTNLAASVVAKEAVELYDSASYVGTGPFMVKQIEPNNSILLVRNNKYYKKDKEGLRLPYLDSVLFSFEGSTVKELDMFVNNQLDIVLGLNNEFAVEIIRNYTEKFESNPPEYKFIPQVNTDSYHLLKSNVHGFRYENHAFDMSHVYFMIPQPTVQ